MLRRLKVKKDSVPDTVKPGDKIPGTGEGNSCSQGQYTPPVPGKTTDFHPMDPVTMPAVALIKGLWNDMVSPDLGAFLCGIGIATVDISGACCPVIRVAIEPTFDQKVNAADRSIIYREIAEIFHDKALEAAAGNID